MQLSEQAEAELMTLQGGPILAGLLDPSALEELLEADLIEKYYEGVSGFIGLAIVKLKRKGSSSTCR